MQDGSDSEDAVDSDDEPPPPDHSDYHGRGWQPSQVQPKALEGAAGDAVSSASAAAVTGTSRAAQGGSSPEIIRPQTLKQGLAPLRIDDSDSDDDDGAAGQLMEVSTQRKQPPER